MSQPGDEHVGEFTSQGQADKLTGVAANLPKYEPGLYAGWELDVWGRLRNLANAASHRYLASIEGRNFMVTRLVAEIASSYYELLALDRQLQVITDNIALQERALELRAGAVPGGFRHLRCPGTLRGQPPGYAELAVHNPATDCRDREPTQLPGRSLPQRERSGRPPTFSTNSPPQWQWASPLSFWRIVPDVRQAELELAAGGARRRGCPKSLLSVSRNRSSGRLPVIRSDQAG